MLSPRFLLTFAGAACCALPGYAGPETEAPRKEFHQSAKYPYVFQPDTYLTRNAPAPLRFAAAEPGCHERNAPALPPIPKKPDPAAAKAAETAAAAAAYPPPPAPAAPAGPTVDFSKTPEDVLDFFRQTDGANTRRIYLFDPIFQPVRPNDLPKSKATYTQTP